jgi:hypothetical protein
MGYVSDVTGSPRYGFLVAAGFAGLLFLGLLLNWIFNPTAKVLEEADRTDYSAKVDLKAPREIVKG